MRGSTLSESVTATRAKLFSLHNKQYFVDWWEYTHSTYDPTRGQPQGPPLLILAAPVPTRCFPFHSGRFPKYLPLKATLPPRKKPKKPPEPTALPQSLDTAP